MIVILLEVLVFYAYRDNVDENLQEFMCIMHVIIIELFMLFNDNFT